MSKKPDLNPIFDHIDTRFSDYASRIRRYLRQPGVSTTGEGIRESAELSQALMDEIGITTPNWSRPTAIRSSSAG